MRSGDGSSRLLEEVDCTFLLLADRDDLEEAARLGDGSVSETSKEKRNKVHTSE